jgi:ferrous iron transport protein A
MFGKWFRFLNAKHVAEEQREITLKDVRVGETAVIESLRGEPSVCQRLREMGFCESSVVQKLADSGALICKVCETKIIISKKLANNIIVKNAYNRSYPIKETEEIILLSQMTVGQQGIVYDFACEDEDSERVEEMGLTPGEPIEIVRYAPLGDPIEVKIRGYLLSLRKQEADLIQVRIPQ